MLLFSVYNIEREVAIYLSIKRRGCVHPLRPPSSNHCEEVLSFPDKAANLRLFYFGKEQGTSLFTTGKCYTPSGYDSILRLVTARDQVLQFFFSFCPRAGHKLLSIFTTKFYRFVNKSFYTCCRILHDVFIALGEMVIIRIVCFSRIDDKSWYLGVCITN